MQTIKEPWEEIPLTPYYPCAGGGIIHLKNEPDASRAICGAKPGQGELQGKTCPACAEAAEAKRRKLWKQKGYKEGHNHERTTSREK